MKRLSFSQLIKWVHPDTNPSIEDPSTKIIEATRHKDDEETLYRLAIKWGLIEDDYTSTFNPEYKMNEGKNLEIKGDKCIIVDTFWRNNKYIIVVFNRSKATFQKFERTDEWDQDEEFMATGVCIDNDYPDIDYKYQVIKRDRGGI